jgi:predicted transposase YbfD/YdcC
MKDSRVERTRVQLFEDIIFITIAAVICGAETWNETEDYGKEKETWLCGFLKLPGGIPSHDTFNRFFAALDPETFELAFLSWVREVCTLTDVEVIAIDGKTLCGSRSGAGKRAVHIVSAWASVNRLSLAQVKVDEKSNEITAISELLNVLMLKGCLVTIDATGCQREIAAKTVEREADCILAVRGNRGTLEENVKDTARFIKSASEWREEDFGHGRIDTRRCSVYRDLSLIENVAAWKSLNAVLKIESRRYFKATGKKTEEIRYCITGSTEDAEKLGCSVRFHWGIENNVHWQLGVSFNEDDSRKRDGFAAPNFSMINRVALNLIKHEKTQSIVSIEND